MALRLKEDLHLTDMHSAMRRRPFPLFPLLSLGLAAVLSACNQDHTTTPTSPTPQPTVVSYTAVGASDAIAIGASHECFPFAACPDGTGYVQVTKRRLEAAGKTVTLLNLGIPGTVLGPDIEAIGNSLGRGIPGNFLEREMPFVARDATLVTIFAGGNDVNTAASAIEAGMGGSDPVSYGNTLANGFGRDYNSLVAGIKSRAANARIIALNLPNLSALPYNSGRTLAQRQGIQALAVAFSAKVNALSSQGVLVIDLMCDPRSYIAGNYSSDGFHPNDSGYAFIADLVFSAANTGTAATPRSSCAQMAQF
jgi:lysophospholipase L1-like esterase